MLNSINSINQVNNQVNHANMTTATGVDKKKSDNILAYLSFVYSFLKLLHSGELSCAKAQVKVPSELIYQTFPIQTLYRQTKSGEIIYSFSDIDAEKLVHVTNEKTKKTKTISAQAIDKTLHDIRQAITRTNQKNSIDVNFLNVTLARFQLPSRTDFDQTMDVWKIGLIENKKLLYKNFIFSRPQAFEAQLMRVKKPYYLKEEMGSEMYFFRLQGLGLTESKIEEINALSGPYSGSLKLMQLNQANISIHFDREKTLFHSPLLKANKLLYFNSFLSLYATLYSVVTLDKMMPLLMHHNPLALEADKKFDFYKKALQFYGYRAYLGLPLLENVSFKDYAEADIDGYIELKSFTELSALLNVENKERLDIKNYTLLKNTYTSVSAHYGMASHMLKNEKITQDPQHPSHYHIALSLGLQQKAHHFCNRAIADIEQTTQEMKKLQAKAQNPLNNVKNRVLRQLSGKSNFF